MISRQRLRNKLLELGFRFSLRTKRVEVHRQKGCTKRVEITHNTAYSEAYVRIVLKQAGLEKDGAMKSLLKRSAIPNAHLVPRPGEIRLKAWALDEGEKLGIRPASVLERVSRGQYPNLKIRRVNQRVIFVQPQ